MFKASRGLALPALALFFVLASPAQVITTGGGTVQANDGCWTGGALFPVPVIPPGTLPGQIRYGAAFSCTIPVQATVPWLVTFHFVEPCAVGGGCSSVVPAGGRLFSVAINDTPALQDLDICARAGSLNPLTRSVLVWPGSDTLRITFAASMRTAVISSIDYNTVALPQMWQTAGGEARITSGAQEWALTGPPITGPGGYYDVENHSPGSTRAGYGPAGQDWYSDGVRVIRWFRFRP